MPYGPGQTFTGELTAREVDDPMDQEWAVSAEDVLWRRTKLGLEPTPDEVRRPEGYMAGRRGGGAVLNGDGADDHKHSPARSAEAGRGQ